MLCERGQWNEIYNVGTGQGVTVVNVIEILERISGRKLDVRYSPSRSLDVAANILDMTKTFNSVGEYEFTSLENGMRNLLKGLS